jgi:hypothetical protein
MWRQHVPRILSRDIRMPSAIVIVRFAHRANGKTQYRVTHRLSPNSTAPIRLTFGLCLPYGSHTAQAARGTCISHTAHAAPILCMRLLYSNQSNSMTSRRYIIYCAKRWPNCAGSVMPGVRTLVRVLYSSSHIAIIGPPYGVISLPHGAICIQYGTGPTWYTQLPYGPHMSLLPQ